MVATGNCQFVVKILSLDLEIFKTFGVCQKKKNQAKTWKYHGMWEPCK